LDRGFIKLQNWVLPCHNGSVLHYLSKLVLFLLILFLPVYYHHIWDIWLLFVIFITFTFVCFRAVLVQTKVRFVISSLNQCSFCCKLYSCCVFVFFYFSYLCHVSRKGEGTKEDSSSRMRKTKPWFGGFRRRS